MNHNQSLDDTKTVESSVGYDGFEGSQASVANIWLRSLELDGPAQLVLLDRLHQPFYLPKNRKLLQQEAESREFKRAEFLAQRESHQASKAGAGNRARILSDIAKLCNGNNGGNRKQK